MFTYSYLVSLLFVGIVSSITSCTDCTTECVATLLPISPFIKNDANKQDSS